MQNQTVDKGLAAFVGLKTCSWKYWQAWISPNVNTFAVTHQQQPAGRPVMGCRQQRHGALSSREGAAARCRLLKAAFSLMEQQCQSHDKSDRYVLTLKPFVPQRTRCRKSGEAILSALMNGSPNCRHFWLHCPAFGENKIISSNCLGEVTSSALPELCQTVPGFSAGWR